MSEPFKIDRKLPPHELNARRNRKRTLTKLPGVAQLNHPNPAPPTPPTTATNL
ncbi:MAG: hypothetical protein WBY53_08355 [Acidobacteriaceae bacterium]